jgi:hypothetical protein
MGRRAAIITEVDLRRAIRAVQKEGLHVVGVRPDGTLLVSKVPLNIPADMVFHDNEWSNPEL